MDTVKCLVAKGVHADIEDCDGVVIHKSTTENRHRLVSHHKSCIYMVVIHKSTTENRHRLVSHHRSCNHMQIISLQISLCAI